MKLKIMVVFLLMFAASYSYAGVREDSNTVVKSEEKYYKVKYPSGQVDRFVFVFNAHLVSYMRQDGSSSTLTHPTDTRRCDYHVKSYIQRDGYYLTGAGKRVPLNEIIKVYGSSSGAYRTNDFLSQVFGQHSPCNDYTSDFNNRKANVTKEIIKDLDTFLLTDVFKTSVQEAEVAIGSDAKFIIE
jgi:hypothetical protein